MVVKVIELLGFVKAAACAGIFWRVYTYHWPKESRYRLGITAVAYLMMFLVGGQAICIMMDAPGFPQYFDAGIYLAFFALVVMARGNVANILKMDYHHAHK